MKTKDISIIIVSSVLAVILSVIISRSIFSKSTVGRTVEVVPTITSYLPTPDTRYFNSSAIDPTLFISIGNSANNNPFNSTTGQ